MNKVTVALAAAIGCGAFGVTQASADEATYCFSLATGPNSSQNDIDAIESQIFMDVCDDGDEVIFHFRVESGALDGFGIGAIFFDNDGGSIALPLGLDEGPGVEFSAPAGQDGSMLGGLGPDFDASVGFSADNDPGAANRIDVGEWLEISFAISGSFSDVIDALDLGLADGGLAVGIHVQGIGNQGQSDWFLSKPLRDPPMVPLPTTVTLGLAGLAPLGMRRRRS